MFLCTDRKVRNIKMAELWKNLVWVLNILGQHSTAAVPPDLLLTVRPCFWPAAPVYSLIIVTDLVRYFYMWYSVTTTTMKPRLVLQFIWPNVNVSVFTLLSLLVFFFTCCGVLTHILHLISGRKCKYCHSAREVIHPRCQPLVQIYPINNKWDMMCYIMVMVDVHI